MSLIIVSDAHGKWREEQDCKVSEPSNCSFPFVGGTRCVIDILELSGHGLEEGA